MIRVELLHGRSRQLSSWVVPALFALVLCGGLYGLNWLYPLGQIVDLSTDDPVASKGLWQVGESSVSGQSAANDPWAEESAADPWASDNQGELATETAVDSAGWENGSLRKTVVDSAEPIEELNQESVVDSVGPDYEPIPKPKQVLQEAPIVSAVPLVTDFPQPSGDGNRPVGTRSPPPRSAACQWAVRINERVPIGVRLVSLTCDAAGEYVIEGTTTSQQSLRAFNELLQKLPSHVTLSSWQEGKASAKVLRFAFDGRFPEQPVRELATLSSDQADRLFVKIANWADESGLDGLSIKKTITIPLPPARVQQRQKLRGRGSYQQIDAFLQKLRQVEEIAVLGEVVLMPVPGDGHGWAEARLYAAVDVVVGMP